MSVATAYKSNFDNRFFLVDGVGVNSSENDNTIKTISNYLPTNTKLVLFTVNDIDRFYEIAPFVDGIVTDFFVSKDMV